METGFFTDIQEALDDLGLSLSEAARRCGINKGHLSEIVRGIRIPTNEQVHAIAQVIGRPVGMYHVSRVTPRG